MEQKRRVALFIDAENASAQHAENCLRHCESKGWLSIRRCYGSDVGLKAWEQANAEHHILPMRTPPSAGKTNASDFSLVIDAVSLLHRDRYDHAVIVSSDSDFILLALHLREHGKTVSGVVTENADEKLRSAFTEVVVLASTKVPQLKPPEQSTAPKPKPPQQNASPKPKMPEQKTVAEKPEPGRAVKVPVASSAPVKTVDSAWLSQMFARLAGTDGHCNYEEFKRSLAKEKPGYQHGHGKADAYVKKSGLFEVRNKLLIRRAVKPSS
jgi:hypothetical protein